MDPMGYEWFRIIPLPISSTTQSPGICKFVPKSAGAIPKPLGAFQSHGRFGQKRTFSRRSNTADKCKGNILAKWNNIAPT